MKFISILFLLVCSLIPAPAGLSSGSVPDIVVIMADDMGFSDIGCFGSEIPTPNLDALAGRGIRLTRFHNTSRCCPSRASLLTGLYSHQAGVGSMNTHDTGPGYRGQLDKNIPTLPEFMRAAGYRTSMVGKWHLTFSRSIDLGPNGSWPVQRGFDDFFGSMEGAKNYFNPPWFFDGVTPVTQFDPEFFYTDAVSRRACEYIEETSREKPLFLYAAFYAPHFPLQAPEDIISSFRGKYISGWDRIREKRFKKQLLEGILPEGTALAARPSNLPEWNSLTPEQKDEMDLRMAIYASQVHLLDRGVGRIVQALKKAGRFENTLLIFLSDNGGTDSGGAMGAGPRAGIGGPDTPIRTTYGAGWAMVSNTPFKEFKANTHQGGIMSPLILSWPEKLVHQGSIQPVFSHITDIVPTCLEAAGLDPAGLTALSRSPQLPGRSLLPVVSGETESLDEKRVLYFEHQKSRAILSFPFKAVNKGTSDAWELYNIHKDPVEGIDLAKEIPATLRSLTDQWMAWATRNHVKF